jgi:hypothetical protein
MKKYWEISIFGLLILVAIVLSFIFFKELSEKPVSDIYLNIIIAILTGFIISIITAIIITKYQYLTIFNQLCEEIETNYQKMSKENIESQFYRMREKAGGVLAEGDWIGFQKEISPYVILFNAKAIGQDHWRYLSSNAFKNFILNGAYTHIENQIMTDLDLFYFYCDAFSTAEQDIEKEVMKSYGAGILNNRLLEIYISNIEYIQKQRKNQIDIHYPNVTSHFKKINVWDLENWVFD